MLTGCKASVVNAVARADIHIPVEIRIRIYRRDIVDPALIRQVVTSAHGTVFQCEHETGLGHAVDHAVGTRDHRADILIPDTRIFQSTNDHRLVDLDNAARRTAIDISLLIFGDGSHGERLQAFLRPEHLRLSLVDHGDAAVVRAYPETVLAVHQQAHDARDTGRRIHSFKRVAVVADQTAVASDPDKALRGLRDGVGLGSGKSGTVVVQGRHVPLIRPREIQCVGISAA